MQTLDRKFTKTYGLSVAGHRFKYSTLVRHKGSVVAFAMDDQQKIYYTVLDLDRQGVNSAIDAVLWDENRKNYANFGSKRSAFPRLA